MSNFEITKTEAFKAGIRAGKQDMANKIKELIEQGYDLDYIKNYVTMYGDIVSEIDFGE